MLFAPNCSKTIRSSNGVKNGSFWTEDDYHSRDRRSIELAAHLRFPHGQGPHHQQLSTFNPPWMMAICGPGKAMSPVSGQQSFAVHRQSSTLDNQKSKIPKRFNPVP
jgi:hypothetical protein